MGQDRMPWVVIMGVLAAQAGPAVGQIGTQSNEIVPLVVDSGVHDNPSPNTEVVFESVAHFGDVAWFRLLFDDARLGPGSFLRITSLEDGAVQDLGAAELEQWQMSSAYFNGGSALLTLFAGPNTAGNYFRTSGAAVGAPPGPQPRTICDEDDERIADARDGIARMVSLSLNGPCSGTIVSADGCFFSAGHCLGVLGVAQFNVPQSSPTGVMRHPEPSDQYLVNPSSITANAEDVGDDYAYFSCLPNGMTGLTPLEAEGVFYPLAASLPEIGTLLRVTGFGADDGSANNTQQTDTGPLVNIGATSIGHRVDTTGGSSGSSIVIEATDELIGIHTHGGCSLNPNSFNSGTSILHPELHPELICCVPPEIVTHPQPADVCAGDSVVFSVEVNGAGLSYQWIHDGGAIPGATESILTIDFVQPQDAGAYACIVGAPCATISQEATLTVDPPPTIEEQPMSTVTCIDASVTLHIALSGPGPFTYQWRLDGEPIPGEIDPTLVIDPVTQDDFGKYRCMVGDTCGVALSDPAMVEPAPPVVITAHPVDADGAVGGSVFFSVSATGGALWVQWRKDGVDLPGQTSLFLILTDLQCEDAGVYDAMVGNLCMSVKSDGATLTVQPCPGSLPGDSDGDGDVDLVDFAGFLSCVSGPGEIPPSSCDVFDFEPDGDVDLHDAGAFQLAFTGQ